MINVILYLIIFIVAVTMTMVGKGGGNFYVVILAMASIPMHIAASTGQFILCAASLSAMVVFHKKKSMSWKLAIILGTITALFAFLGGFFSHDFSATSLKCIFAFMLVASGAIMLFPIGKLNKGTIQKNKNSIFKVPLHLGSKTYHINLLIVIPVTVLTGFASGMVGVSGGSFLVPLMVIAAGVPMNIAVGTSSIFIAATSGMGFIGHAMQGDFDPSLALPLAVVTIIGGIIGGLFALKSKPKNLKKIFAYTNFLAALMMVYQIIM